MSDNAGALYLGVFDMGCAISCDLTGESQATRKERFLSLHNCVDIMFWHNLQNYVFGIFPSCAMRLLALL